MTAQNQTHGPAGPSNNAYRLGCRCVECRGAHAATARAYKNRRTVPKPGAPVPAAPAGPGPIETAVAAQLSTLASTAPWAETWRLLALFDARLIDDAIRTDQHHIVATMQSRLRDCMDRLGSGAPKGPEDSAGWAAFARDL